MLEKKEFCHHLTFRAEDRGNFTYSEVSIRSDSNYLRSEELEAARIAIQEHVKQDFGYRDNCPVVVIAYVVTVA